MLRDLYFYKRADFSLWVFIHVSIYTHPSGRPVGTVRGTSCVDGRANPCTRSYHKTVAGGKIQ